MLVLRPTQGPVDRPSPLGTIAWRDDAPAAGAHGIYLDLRDEPLLPLRTFDTRFVGGKDAGVVSPHDYDERTRPALAAFHDALIASGLLGTAPTSTGDPGLAPPGHVVIALLNSGETTQRNWVAPRVGAPQAIADVLAAAQQLKSALEVREHWRAPQRMMR